MNNFSVPVYLKNTMDASPDFIMALAFLATWIEPTALGNNMLNYFSLIMLLEFIIIHSAGFMGFAIISGKTIFQKISRVIGLGLFYSLFVWAFCASTGETWPMAAFWILLLNRILGGIFEKESETTFQTVVMVRWGWSVFCYLISIAFSAMMPIPRFGWSDEIVQQLGSGGKGLWLEQPHTLLAAGFFYFLLISIFEMYGHRVTVKFAETKTSATLSNNNTL